MTREQYVKVDKIYKELKELCNNDLEDLRHVIDYLEDRRYDDKRYEDNSDYYDSATEDDRRDTEIKENN